MINYFIYRISSNYDGYTPSRIPYRTNNNRFIYNWNAYFESVNKGDIILTVFQGKGVNKGIYAITRVKGLRYHRNGNIVTGKIIYYSSNDKKPIIDNVDYPELFTILTNLRPRGSEIVIPQKYESEVYRMISEHKRLFQELKNKKVRLPGSPQLPTCDVTEIKRVKKYEYIQNLNYKLIPTFWVKPRQTTWMKNVDNQLNSLTRAFNLFKAGDLTHIEEFADAVEDQIRTKLKKEEVDNIGLITSVPLNNNKKKHKEIDRVKELAHRVADRLGIEYSPLFTLKGEISRRKFKNENISKRVFEQTYKNSLRITSLSRMKQLANENKMLLLMDDVLTDGLTTKIISDYCKSFKDCKNLNIIIVTLGIMVKKHNCTFQFIRRYE